MAGVYTLKVQSSVVEIEDYTGTWGRDGRSFDKDGGKVCEASPCIEQSFSSSSCSQPEGEPDFGLFLEEDMGRESTDEICWNPWCEEPWSACATPLVCQGFPGQYVGEPTMQYLTLATFLCNEGAAENPSEQERTANKAKQDSETGKTEKSRPRYGRESLIDQAARKQDTQKLKLRTQKMMQQQCHQVTHLKATPQFANFCHSCGASCQSCKFCMNCGSAVVVMKS
jgi:hypothetical protein